MDRNDDKGRKNDGHLISLALATAGFTCLPFACGYGLALHACGVHYTGGVLLALGAATGLALGCLEAWLLARRWRR